jgi:hypothetical protein
MDASAAGASTATNAKMATTLRIFSPFLFPSIQDGSSQSRYLGRRCVVAGIVVLAQSPDTFAQDISLAKAKKAGAP